MNEVIASERALQFTADYRWRQAIPSQTVGFVGWSICGGVAGQQSGCQDPNLEGEHNLDRNRMRILQHPLIIKLKS